MKQPKKLIAPEKDDRNELYFEIIRSCTRDYHSGEAYGEWETIYESNLKRVSKNSDFLSKWNFEGHKVSDVVYNSKYIYVVTVNYDSGDTFGRSRGNLAIAFVTENADEAVECQKSLKDSTWDIKFRNHEKSVHSGYAPWDGYFESINNVNIEFIPIMD